MTAMRAKDRCGSFLRPGRTAERSGNRRNRSISAYSGHFDVKELGIKDCVLIDELGYDVELVYKKKP